MRTYAFTVTLLPRDINPLLYVRMYSPNFLFAPSVIATIAAHVPMHVTTNHDVRFGQNYQ
jgi:hypothetical protein